MESEKKESLKEVGKKVKTLALFALAGICMWCLAFYTKPSDEEVKVLEFNKSTVYKITNGVIEDDGVFYCKTDSVIFQFKADSTVSVTIGDRVTVESIHKIIKVVDTEVGRQYVFKGLEDGAISAVTPVHHDSTIVVHTGTHLIIFHKGNKCLRFSDLPTPN